MGVMNDSLTSDLFPQALLPIMLRGPVDLEGFRRAARGLLAQNMLPEQVRWHSTDTPAQSQNRQAPENAAGPNGVVNDAPAIHVPPEFMTLVESVILHSDPLRFNLLYRIFWRLAHEPGLRHDPLDADTVQARQMAEEVRNDMHKMKAFVLFHTLQDETFRRDPEGGPLHVAWYASEHHIVEAVAPLFAQRFSQMRGAILTPECSFEWDCVRRPPEAVPDDAPCALRFGPGAPRGGAPAPDAGQQLWLTYYQRIFHPPLPTT